MCCRLSELCEKRALRHFAEVTHYVVHSTTGQFSKAPKKGRDLQVYRHFPQNELGILTAPGGKVHVAWFCDPDGNVLSVTNA
jgi:hypothetical protein